jgi:uncharacterized protein
VRFWDTSGLVPLLVDESFSSAMRESLRADPGVVVWWATGVECVSAIARRERLEHAASDGTTTALAALEDLSTTWVEVPPSDTVREDARRLVRVHDLRAADALQLAAARVAARGHSDALAFVTLDERLALAASREGFPIVGL